MIASSHEFDCLSYLAECSVCTTKFRTCFRKSNFLTSNFYRTCNVHTAHMSRIIIMWPYCFALNVHIFLTLYMHFIFFSVTFGCVAEPTSSVAAVIGFGTLPRCTNYSLVQCSRRPLRSAENRNMYQRLVHLTNKYKILRGMISYAILWPVGNLIEQRLVEKKTFETFDWKKCLRCVPLNWVFGKPPYGIGALIKNFENKI